LLDGITNDLGLGSEKLTSVGKKICLQPSQKQMENLALFGGTCGNRGQFGKAAMAARSRSDKANTLHVRSDIHVLRVGGENANFIIYYHSIKLL
jgi:hypothetical protein